jgi:hypothetical protein
MGRVVIGMDPHKRSATIEVLDEREPVLRTADLSGGRGTVVVDLASCLVQVGLTREPSAVFGLALPPAGATAVD